MFTRNKTHHLEFFKCVIPCVTLSWLQWNPTHFRKPYSFTELFVSRAHSALSCRCFISLRGGRECRKSCSFLFHQVWMEGLWLQLVFGGVTCLSFGYASWWSQSRRQMSCKYLSLLNDVSGYSLREQKEGECFWWIRLTKQQKWTKQCALQKVEKITFQATSLFLWKAKQHGTDQQRPHHARTFCNQQCNLALFFCVHTYL